MVTAAGIERAAVAAAAGADPAIGMVDGLEVHRLVTGAGLVDVVTSGVGPVASSIATSCALRNGYDLAVSAGIGGGFGAAAPGDVVLADTVVHADLGAQTPDGFTSMAELGWARVRFQTDQMLLATLRVRTKSLVGAVLTVSTVTGSRQRAEELTAEHPDALAEGMEGVGVYQAAARCQVPFAEVRAISNPVGPRDRDSWQVQGALKALTAAFTELLADPITV